VGASYRAAVEASQRADAEAATAAKKQAAAAQAASCLAGFAAAARADASNPSSSSGTVPGSLEGAEAAVADFASFFRNQLGSLSLDGSGRRSPTPVLGPAGGQQPAVAATGGPLGLFGVAGAWGEARSGWAEAADAAASGEATASADDEAAESLDTQLLPRPVQLAAWLPGLPEPSAYGPGDDGAVEGADYSGATAM